MRLRAASTRRHWVNQAIGAIVTDAQGSPWTFASRSFVAAAPGLHAKVIEILADVTVDSCEAA